MVAFVDRRVHIHQAQQYCKMHAIISIEFLSLSVDIYNCIK